MSQPDEPLPDMRIATPCEAGWETMSGDERVRHCTLCSLNVYNFSEMTSRQVRELLERTEGGVCARLYRRADGTVLTRDCPTGLRALGLRASRAAAALLTALFAFPAFASGNETWTSFKTTRGPEVKVRVEHSATRQAAMLTGVVSDTSDPLPGVSIVVRNETTKSEVTATTDGNGAFSIAPLAHGVYSVVVSLAGFEPMIMEHLKLQTGELTQARITLVLAAGTGQITVTRPEREPGIEMKNDGNVTTISTDFISKMPY